MYDIDVIAVHGLGGDLYKTWACDRSTTNNEEIFKLFHLLPHDLPGARIFTFRYPSQWSSSYSVAGVKEFARSLLQALRQLSDKVACTNLLLGLELTFKGNIYPHIIFVGHSLGGTVVKRLFSATFRVTIRCLTFFPGQSQPLMKILDSMNSF